MTVSFYSTRGLAILADGASLRQDNSPPLAGAVPARNHRVYLGSGK